MCKHSIVPTQVQQIVPVPVHLLLERSMHFNEVEFKLARQETQIFTHRPPILLRDISIVFLLHHHRHHSPPPLTQYEALVSNTTTPAKTSDKKWILAALNFFALIPSRSISHIDKMFWS